jgi:hypothetical protein
MKPGNGICSWLPVFLLKIGVVLARKAAESKTSSPLKRKQVIRMRDTRARTTKIVAGIFAESA